jgi:quinolinate synthase
MAAASSDCRYIVFCGVHFMAETADILANRPEKLAERGGERVTVVLPDMAAGCSMADMAAIEQVEAAWADLGEVIDTSDITPVTYINSAASLKAFCGRHGGIVCTSSNAGPCWSGRSQRTKRVLLLSRSAPGPQHGAEDGHHQRPDAGLDPYEATRRQQRSGYRKQQGDPLEGALQRASDVPRRACRAVPQRIPASRFWSIPNARRK